MRESRQQVGQDTAVEFYFDFLSPFGWIGAERIGAIARRFGRRVVWRPFLLKATVRDAMGLPPPLETPLKGAYLRRDIPRSLRLHGLSLSPQARFGFSSVDAARAVIWVRDRSGDALTEALVLSLYRAHWSQARDISERTTILDVAEPLGLGRDDLAAALADPQVKDALRRETERAIRNGVFGSPTIAVEDELFWGSDRLGMVETWLKTGGW